MNISLDAIVALIERHSGDSFYLATEYGEPGYDQPKAGWIIVANWNGRNDRGAKVLSTLGNWLEHHGYSIEWFDEWITDDNGRKAYRTVPDSMMWRPSYSLSPNGSVYGHTISKVRDAVRTYIAWRDGDEWGNCSNWLFAACCELHERGLEIPCQFSPGAGGGDCREWGRSETEECAQMTDNCLSRFAALLSKHYDNLKAKGLSY